MEHSTANQQIIQATIDNEAADAAKLYTLSKRSHYDNTMFKRRPTTSGSTGCKMIAINHVKDQDVINRGKEAMKRYEDEVRARENSTSAELSKPEDRAVAAEARAYANVAAGREETLRVDERSGLSYSCRITHDSAVVTETITKRYIQQAWVYRVTSHKYNWTSEKYMVRNHASGNEIQMTDQADMTEFRKLLMEFRKPLSIEDTAFNANEDEDEEWCKIERHDHKKVEEFEIIAATEGPSF